MLIVPRLLWWVLSSFRTLCCKHVKKARHASSTRSAAASGTPFKEQILENFVEDSQIVEISEASRLVQIWIIAGSRAVLNSARICIGPLMVSMVAEYNYTKEEEGQILSAFASGYFWSMVPGGMVADQFGGAPVLTICLASQALFLMLVPLSADMRMSYLWAVLWAMGFGAGPSVPAMSAIISKWSSGSLRSYASALSIAGATFGAFLGLGLIPILAGRIGWRNAARLLGFAQVCYCFFCFAKCRSRPFSDEGQDQNVKAPDRSRWVTCVLSIKLLVAPPVLAIFAAHAIYNFVRYFGLSWIPTYYAEELQVRPSMMGMCLTLPELLAAMSGIGSAGLAKRLQQQGTLSALGCRRAFSAAGFIGQATSLASLAVTRNLFLVTLAFGGVQGFGTLHGAGFFANYLDVTKNSSGLVMGVGDSLATLASGLGPRVASWVLASCASTQYAMAACWHTLFLGFAGASILGLMLFMPFSSATPVDTSWKIEK